MSFNHLVLLQFPPAGHCFGEFLLKCRAFEIIQFDLDGKRAPPRLVVKYLNEQTLNFGHYFCLSGVFLAYCIGLHVSQPGKIVL